MRLLSNVSVRVENRETGHVHFQRARFHNKITTAGVDKLLDLIDGSSSDHISSTGQITLRTGASVFIKTLGVMSGGFPNTPVSRIVTFKWVDATIDVYTAANVFLNTQSGFNIAESLATGWPTKGANETWTFTWTLSLVPVGSDFSDVGLNGMLRCVTGLSNAHFDGTEGSSNMRIKVFNGSPGVLQFERAVTAIIQRTGTSLKWLFVRTGVATWARVETHNNGQGVKLFDDDIPDREQLGGDIFTYEITLDFGGSPATPTGLFASDVLGNVELTWTDRAVNEDSYSVQREEDGLGFADIVTGLPPNSFTFTDTTALMGVPYNYRVFAINSDGGSAFSNVASITI